MPGTFFLRSSSKKPKMLDQKKRAIQAKVRINRPIIRKRVKSELSLGMTVIHFRVANRVLTNIRPKTLRRRRRICRGLMGTS